MLLEAVRSHDGFGECFGTVGGLIDGLGNSSGQALLDAGARRMRALTGYDRVTLTWGQRQAESSRGSFPARAKLPVEMPSILCDIDAQKVEIFPRRAEETAVCDAVVRSPDRQTLEELRSEGVCACLTVPFSADDTAGAFRCDSRTARKPHFEMHAAAELFVNCSR